MSHFASRCHHLILLTLPKNYLKLGALGYVKLISAPNFPWASHKDMHLLVMEFCSWEVEAQVSRSQQHGPPLFQPGPLKDERENGALHAIAFPWLLLLSLKRSEGTLSHVSASGKKSKLLSLSRLLPTFKGSEEESADCGISERTPMALVCQILHKRTWQRWSN